MPDVYNNNSASTTAAKILALFRPDKGNIRSRVASTIQLASLTDSNLTKDERQALKWLKTDKSIDRGWLTVVMDKTDYYDKMDTLVNKYTSKELKRDPTPTLWRKLNSNLLDLNKTDVFDIPRYNRLRCRVPQLQNYKLPKLYRLSKLHKPNIPMRPIIQLIDNGKLGKIRLMN